MRPGQRRRNVGQGKRGRTAEIGDHGSSVLNAHAMPLEFSLTPGTRFAPAEREPLDVIQAEQAAILGNGATAAILDTLREPVAVLNGLRQIVHANRSFLAFAGATSLDEILGMRLGEFLGCAHASDAGGCGTHPTCQTCGAVNAVLSAAAGAEMTSEADLALTAGGRERRLRFDITAAPFESGGWRFVLTTIRGVRWTSAR